MKNIKKTISTLRWITRILSIAIALVFLVFFIGENFIADIPELVLGEVFMLLCIPLLLIIGMVIAWKKEILGGLLIIVSILLFNAAAMISEGKFTLELEFGLFLVIGLVFIICGIATKRLET